MTTTQEENCLRTENNQCHQFIHNNRFKEMEHRLSPEWTKYKCSESKTKILNKKLQPLLSP